MRDAWKRVLYRYIQHHNQMEADYALDPLIPFIIDEQYIRLQKSRLQRLKEWHALRGMQPLRCETRAKLLHVSENRNGSIVACLQLKKRLEYVKGPASERIENERATLSLVGGTWFLSKIEPDLSERQNRPAVPERPAVPSSAPSGNKPPGPAKSIPYLNHQILSHSSAASRDVKYMRMKAKQYADQWWNGYNPEFLSFDVDCTNFVSQCLYAGGIPMHYTGKRDSGWWYQGRQGQREMWSYSWAVSHSLQAHMASGKSALRAEEVDSPELLDIGDVISYDWDGDSNFQHTAIVAAADGRGMPLVNAHTTNSKHRFWDYRDSYAWNERTRYRFFHIL